MNHLGDVLSALLDGELGGTERGEAERHLAECEACRLELSLIESARGVVRALPSLEPPPGLLPTRLRRRRWVLSPAWITTVAVAVALAFGLVVGPGEPGEAFEMDTLNEQHIARVVGDPGIATFRGDSP
ncbi:MAG TPA: zf-HC2 domain-containing protein [Acidimicrobiia bacterium]|nr:zf-HC2 domain-containing protein [Acidimicrobiia bacterium]